MESYKKILTVFLICALFTQNTLAKPFFFFDNDYEDSREDDFGDTSDEFGSYIESVINDVMDGFSEWFDSAPKNCTVICINCGPVTPSPSSDSTTVSSTSDATTTTASSTSSTGATASSSTSTVATTSTTGSSTTVATSSSTAALSTTPSTAST